MNELENDYFPHFNFDGRAKTIESGWILFVGGPTPFTVAGIPDSPSHASLRSTGHGPMLGGEASGIGALTRALAENPSTVN